ncbi:MAG TPA: helix-turn-helix domain-containing protein [Drouetiella sp.]
MSSVFFALADPTRRAILSRLTTGSAGAEELLNFCSADMFSLRKHLDILESAGLIAQSRDATWHRCKFELNRLDDVSNWIEQYKPFWDGNLDNLELFLRSHHRD